MFELVLVFQPSSWFSRFHSKILLLTLTLLWAVILTAYILGIVAFVGTLFSWTETGGSLYWAK